MADSQKMALSYSARSLPESRGKHRNYPEEASGVAGNRNSQAGRFVHHALLRGELQAHL
jgi:hypothetical protein